MSEEAATRYRENLEALRARHPEVADSVESVGEAKSRLIEVDGVAVNIDLGGGNLYPEPDPGWTTAQLESFRRYPERIGLFDPSYCNLSPVSLKLHGELTGYLLALGRSGELSAFPEVDVGYLFVFGIGLGRHLAALLEETPARNVVLIEPVTEFLRHSLATIDWPALFAKADERGIRLHFVLSGDPEEIVGQVEKVVSREGNVFLEGSYFCPHYYSWAFKEAFKQIKERIKCYYTSSGFFEDEIEMMRNCSENLRRWSFHLIETKPFREQKLPVFIVGAGPSLDNDLPVIRKWRERVLVVSCGTTLGILLKNDIRPDLHCEIERGKEVFDILSPLQQRFGFDGITLVTTTTVDPRVSGLFAKRWYFYRSGLSPATVLRGSARPLLGVDPLVCNAAFAAIAAAGFREIYLFGIDLAQKISGRHHAKDSVYFENAEWDETYTKRFDRQVAGNFGGTVETFWAFDLSRRMLAKVQSHYRPQLFNCSDGAKIWGAQPKIAASVVVGDGLPPRENVLAQVERQMRTFAATEIIGDLDLDRHIDGCDAFAAAFERLLDQVRGGDGGFYRLETGLNRLVDEEGEAFAGVFSIIRGSVVSMIRLGAFFGTRIADAETRRKFFLHFLDRYHQRCLAMVEESRRLLHRVQAGDSLQEPSEAA
jgi:hypothetical protein